VAMARDQQQAAGVTAVVRARAAGQLLVCDGAAGDPRVLAAAAVVAVGGTEGADALARRAGYPRPARGVVAYGGTAAASMAVRRRPRWMPRRSPDGGGPARAPP